MSSRSLIILALPLIFCLGWGCERPTDGPESVSVFQQLQDKTQSRKIAATSYPLVAMAGSITGEEYEVWMPAKADKIPSAEEIRRLQNSDVLLTNGPGTAYATWLPMVTLDRKKIFETTTHSFELTDFIQVREHKIVHSHGGEGEHSHFWMAPHCWLNPRLALLQGKEVCDKLCEMYPEDADSFRANFEVLESSLKEASKAADACKDLLKAKKTSLLLSDPRLKHFARALGAEADCLLWFEPEELQLAKEHLQEKIAQKKTDGQSLLLWARDPTSDECDLVSGLKWVQLDLIESPDSQKGISRRVKDNFKLLVEGVKASVEIKDGSQ